MSSDEVEPHASVKQEVEASSCDFKGEVFSAEQTSSPSPETPPPPGLAVGVITEMEVDDLVFCDDGFPSLPDFPCLSSPSTTASPMSAASKKHKDPCLGSASSFVSSSSSSSVSSSSSSPWSILNVATASDVMQVAPACDVDSVVPNADVDEVLPRCCDEFDILREMELWDPSEMSDTWDNSSSLVPVDNDGSAAQLQPGVDLLGGGEDAECPSEDLAKVFLDWLKTTRTRSRRKICGASR
ncbi:hypothetical protein HPP92_008947 [Vanilla planifolia]|uniref:Uncharacterized protein n=1 Tax=Vanilla planifolia TaxID=51239 RepID=A0A835V4Z3_VANPL|nr:hypothetical protein HPP92_008947 [Vanilla planifolia]